MTLVRVWALSLTVIVFNSGRRARGDELSSDVRSAIDRPIPILREPSDWSSIEPGIERDTILTLTANSKTFAPEPSSANTKTISISLDGKVVASKQPVVTFDADIGRRIQEWIAKVDELRRSGIEQSQTLAAAFMYQVPTARAFWAKQIMSFDLRNQDLATVSITPPISYHVVILASCNRVEDAITLRGKRIVIAPAPLSSTVGSIRQKLMLPCRVFTEDGDFSADLFKLETLGKSTSMTSLKNRLVEETGISEELYYRGLVLASKEQIQAINRCIYRKMQSLMKTSMEKDWRPEQVDAWWAGETTNTRKSKSNGETFLKRLDVIYQQSQRLLGGCSDPIKTLWKIDSYHQSFEKIMNERQISHLIEHAIGSRLILIVDMDSIYLVEARDVLPALRTAARRAVGTERKDATKALNEVQAYIKKFSPKDNLVIYQPTVPPAPIQPSPPPDPFPPNTLELDELIAIQEQAIDEGTQLLAAIDRKLNRNLDFDEQARTVREKTRLQADLQKLAKKRNDNVLERASIISKHERERNAGTGPYSSTPEGRNYMEKRQQWNEAMQVWNEKQRAWEVIRNNIYKEHTRVADERKSLVIANWSDQVALPVRRFESEVRDLNMASGVASVGSRESDTDAKNGDSVIIPRLDLLLLRSPLDRARNVQSFP